MSVHGTVVGDYYGITAKRMMGRREGKGKFPSCQTKQSEEGEIIKKNGTTLLVSIEFKRPICVSTEFLITTLSILGLETRIFGNGTASFGRTGATGQRGPVKEVQGDWCVSFIPRRKLPKILAYC